MEVFEGSFPKEAFSVDKTDERRLGRLARQALSLLDSGEVAFSTATPAIFLGC